MKRVVISGLICMAILFELLTFACCGVKNARLQVVLTDYAAVLESNGLDGLRLSVYYIDPSILTRFPLTEERLLSFESVQRFEVDNAQLLQKTINAEEMTPVSNASVLDARLCCIFESDRAGQILRLTLGGKDNSIFVNEVEVKNCELLRDLLAAFASEETMRVLVHYFDKE